MLLNLEVLKRINWPKLWTTVAKRNTLIYGVTRLADQDIINSVLKENRHLLYELPCVWNVQLSDHTVSYTCYKKQKAKVSWNLRYFMYALSTNHDPINLNCAHLENGCGSLVMKLHKILYDF